MKLNDSREEVAKRREERREQRRLLNRETVLTTQIPLRERQKAWLPF